MLDEKSKIDRMYIGLEKAFDSLTHENLLFMLYTFGIGGNLMGFYNFLTGRFFNVKVSSVISVYTTVSYSIEQRQLFDTDISTLYHSFTSRQ